MKLTLLDMEASDEKLRQILKSFKVSWDTKKQIDEITQALRSKNEIFKRAIIDKYERE